MLPDAAVEALVDDLVEEAADRLLEDYKTSIGGFDYPVPVESIAEHFLGYDLEITNEGLFADPKFLGGISFETNTIFVNASVEDHEGRYSFTIAHEIGHHILHKSLYEELVVDRSQILCREEKKKPLIERQADRFAAALMMPGAVIRRSQAAVKNRRPPSSLSKAIQFAKEIQEECHFSNVSLSAVVNRLKDLDLIDQSIPYQTGVRWRMGYRSSLKYRLYKFLQRIRGG